LIKLIFILLSLLFLTSCSTDYLKDYNLSKKRMLELDSNFTDDDSKIYMLNKIFVDDGLQLNSYFTKEYLTNFCNSHYKINEIYSNNEINDFFTKHSNNYDENMSKFLIYKLQNYKFYIYLYEQFPYFFISIFTIFSLFMIVIIYILYIRILLQNNMVYSAKVRNENDRKYLKSFDIELKQKADLLKRQEVYINEKNDMLQNYPDLLEDYDYLVESIEKKRNELNDLDERFDSLYHRKINEIENYYRENYLEKTTEFEEFCLQKYNIQKNLSNEQIELKKMLKAFLKNMQHIIDNPANNDQINKLFKKVDKLINYFDSIK